MSAVQRKVLLELESEQNGIKFRIESWFMALDHKRESVTRPVLIWDKGDETEFAVMLGEKAAAAVIATLKPFA